MNKEDAEYFAGEMESFLHIPASMCELIMKKLIDGECEKVCEWVVQRRRELHSNGYLAPYENN